MPDTVSVVVAVILALVGVYVAVPAEAVRAVIWMTVGVASATAIIAAVLRNRPADPLPWWLFAAGTGLLANGQAVSLIGGSQPFTDVPITLTRAPTASGGSASLAPAGASALLVTTINGRKNRRNGHRTDCRPICCGEASSLWRHCSAFCPTCGCTASPSESSSASTGLQAMASAPRCMSWMMTARPPTGWLQASGSCESE